MKPPSAFKTVVLLTGATGFIGKVVLEELVRRREELGIGKIFLLIRPNLQGVSAEARFQNEIVSSPCFSLLDPHWTKEIEVVSGELQHSHCGLEEGIQKRLRKEVRLIIHCAASVEFDLPLRMAADANITTSLHVLELARSCRRLQRMVVVSTAYVTPHSDDEKSIQETLVPLPWPAQEIYQKILVGKANEKALLEEIGLPNTYTLTKCLAEHLLVQKKGQVPLTIVRPSIVSACWRRPFPGWIDSHAAFAGFVSLIGAGYLRAVVARYATRLDVIPCDEVARQLIENAFSPKIPHSSDPSILHSVAGKEGSCRIDQCIQIIEDFYRRYPVRRYPHLKYVGPQGIPFQFYDLWRHQLPYTGLSLWYRVTQQSKKSLRVKKLLRQLSYLNKGFPYFTHKSFHFLSSAPLESSFQKEPYIELVCRGVYQHLMKQKTTEVIFAGQQHQQEKWDLRWALKQPHGNTAIRLSAYFARKAFRRCAEEITFDRQAFETARGEIPENSLMVIVPTHRSYMDFVLCSYLFFAHPNLRIAIPHIAAAVEFSKIPFLSWLFKKMKAFYVQRGVGHENPQLTAKVCKLIAQRETLEFFIEGTRSRSRQFLEPRRGILRCLQATGQTCFLLPLSIAYDRIPEEDAFLAELQGGSKPSMRLTPFLVWLGRLLLGKVKLGRIHISCGRPLTLHQTTDISPLSRQIMAELQRVMAVTTYHLHCFLKRNGGKGIDLDWLKNTLIQRGAPLIESSLPIEDLHPRIEETMRYQWIHHFYGDTHLLNLLFGSIEGEMKVESPPMALVG